MKTKTVLLSFLLSAFASFETLAQEKLLLVFSVENTAADFPSPNLPAFGQLPAIQNLPDPFTWADGRGRIVHLSDWRLRRTEIGAQIQNYEIGRKPTRPDSITASYAGGILTVNVTVNGKTLTLNSAVVLPPGSGPFPAVIGMNTPSGSLPSSIFSSRNIAQITFAHNQVTGYNNPQNTDPYYRVYGPELNIDNTGQYSAWAWGVSRIIDGLELVQNTLPIDLKHIAVTGCSYAGKMALYAGAFDERIALTIAQESGGGGATSWRYSQTEPSGSVETVGATSHQWFSEGLFQFSGTNVAKLPFDHHELCAMVAPRALYVSGNPDYTWLSNPSCFVNSAAVLPVYIALGIPERFGYSIVGGHLHCAVPESETPEIEAYVEKFLLGNDSVNTNIAVTPYAVNLDPWITWTRPTLANGTSQIAWTVLRYPADQQTGLDSTVTFHWNQTPGVAQYLVQLSFDPAFTSLERNDSTGTDTLKTFTGLIKGRKYYWRVKAQSAVGVSLWSNVRSFLTVSSPTKPHQLNAVPAQGQQGTVILTWHGVPDATQYFIHECADSSFTRLFRNGQTADTVIVFSGHTEGNQYYWRVQAYNIAGSGPWSDTSNFTLAVAVVQEEKDLPKEFALRQNFPNPFNPTTAISYQLPAVGKTRIAVYDLLGREVAVLVNTLRNPGRYEAQWDATGFPSGVYITRMVAGDFVASRKIVLIK